MTPNPNENQAQKHSAHSPEPWKASILEGKENYIFDAKHFVAVRVDEGPFDFENAARIVACVNFCAGFTKSELQMLGECSNLPTIKSRIALTAELSTLRKELEAAKKAKDWVSEFQNTYNDAERCKMLTCSLIKKLRELLNNGKDGK